MIKVYGYKVSLAPSVVKILLSGPLTFIPFLFLFLGVRFRVFRRRLIQDMLLRLPFLTPETNFPEQKRGKKLSLCASSYRGIFVTPLGAHLRGV